MSLTRQDASHLLRRAGFAALPAEIDKLAGKSRRDAVAAVVDFSDVTVKGPSAHRDTNRSWWDRYVTMSHHWYGRMVNTPTPLAEKMTLFWHGVLTSSIEAASHAALMDQNLVLRRRALGTFDGLVNAVAVDPAMLRYLSNYKNRKKSPNENFGRELLELFTLGVGNYTQDDVISSSRAWTGHTLVKHDDGTETYRFDANQHDQGNKTFLGRTANFDGTDIIAEIVRGRGRDASARHISRKLWSFLAYPEPNPQAAVITHVATTYIASGYSIRELVRAIFMHPEFWSPKARTGLLRSPVEMHVAAMRHLGLTPGVYHPEWYDDPMGQRPFYPPNVGGWQAGASWLSTSAMWAWDNCAQHAMWKANDVKSLPDTRGNRPADAVTVACRHVGIEHVSTPTRQTMEGLVTTYRARKLWGEPQALIVLALLSPEFRQA